MRSGCSFKGDKNMNKKFYIIPGWKETCRRRQYKLLAKSVQKKGYEVVYKNVDWSKKLSDQFFPVEKNSVVFGFSMGAIFARLIVQKHVCAHVILASMTPLEYFKGGKKERLLVDAIGIRTVLDVKKHLKSVHKARKQTIMYGDKEEESADILVKNTQHEISLNYVKAVIKLI